MFTVSMSRDHDLDVDLIIDHVFDLHPGSDSSVCPSGSSSPKDLRSCLSRSSFRSAMSHVNASFFNHLCFMLMRRAPSLVTYMVASPSQSTTNDHLQDSLAISSRILIVLDGRTRPPLTASISFSVILWIVERTRLKLSACC